MIKKIFGALLIGGLSYFLFILARTIQADSTAFFPEKEMKEFFKIPDKYRIICFTPIGIPYEWPATPEKKKIEDLVVFESF